MKRMIVTSLVLFTWVGVFFAHDMFLKLDSFFLKPDTEASIFLLNGTFEKSENVITRDRMLDVSIVGPDRERSHPAAEQWRDLDKTAVLDFKTGEEGTYVVGVSTKRRMIELSGEDFNEYLEHDGVLDVLAARERDGELTKAANERYSKHVKTVIQVGDKRTSGFAARLGYPVELVPLQNPYDLTHGDTFEVLFLKDGEPVANHLVYAGYEGSHQHDNGADDHGEASQTRTNDQGIAEFNLKEPGRWFVRLIHMTKVDEEGVDYESNWATLTFEIR